MELIRYNTRPEFFCRFVISCNGTPSILPISCFGFFGPQPLHLLYGFQTLSIRDLARCGQEPAHH